MDTHHCKFHVFDSHHYNSSNRPGAIAISWLFEKRHYVRKMLSWTHCQALVFPYCQFCPSLRSPTRKDKPPRDLLQREFLSASPTRSSLRSQSVTLDGGVTPCLKYDGEAVGVGGLRRRSGAAATVHEGQNSCRGGPVGGDGSHWRNGGGTRGRRRLGRRRLVQGRLQVCCFEVELILC